MRRRLVTVFAVVALAAGCTSTSHTPSQAAARVAAGSQVPSPHGKAGARNIPAPGAADSGDSLYPSNGNGGYDVQHYTIAIAYDPATHALTGTDIITARATQALSRFDLDLHALNAQSVTVDGHAATSAHSGDKLAITPVRPVPNGTIFTAKIRYGGVPKPYNDKYNGPGGFIAQP